mgnify:CR=1 FL=1
MSAVNLYIKVVQSGDLTGNDRNEIISLCTRAYEEDFGSMFDDFPGSVHILGYADGILVSHAMWITRALQAGNGPVMRTAYIEAVATDKAFRNRGFASQIMRRTAEEIKDFDLGALSPFSEEYYARLGWEKWKGPLFIRTEKGLVRSAEDEEVMILRLPGTPELDLNDTLSAEWRRGELW